MGGKKVKLTKKARKKEMKLSEVKKYNYNVIRYEYADSNGYYESVRECSNEYDFNKYLALAFRLADPLYPQIYVNGGLLEVDVCVKCSGTGIYVSGGGSSNGRFFEFKNHCDCEIGQYKKERGHFV